MTVLFNVNVSYTRTQYDHTVISEQVSVVIVADERGRHVAVNAGNASCARASTPEVYTLDADDGHWGRFKCVWGRDGKSEEVGRSHLRREE